MKFRYLLVASLPILLATAAHAQQTGQPSLKQLQLEPNGRGYAVVIDGGGNEYHCKAEEIRDSVDLGPCKLLRLITPLIPQVAEPELPTMPSMSPAKRSVVNLFERNRCALGYADLRNALQSLGARQRQVIGEMVAEMTERGEIADDAVRERAVLRIGDRCS